MAFVILCNSGILLMYEINTNKQCGHPAFRQPPLTLTFDHLTLKLVASRI